MAFNLRYFGQFRSLKKDQFWRVEISQRDYSGEAEEFLLTADPLSITWEKQGDDFYESVKASEANCNIFCTEQFKYTDLFTQRSRMFRMDIFRNTVLYWRGYLIPDNYSEAFSAPPYHVSVKAVDGFANLDNVLFLDSTGKQFTGRKSLLECITLCVASLDLDLNFSDWFDLYPEGGDEGVSALGQIYLNMSDLYLTNEEPTMRDVLDICLQPFGGQIFQSNGAINIRRIIALKDTVRPLSYFNIAKTLDEKWLVTADGQHLVDAEGNIISVQCARERLDDMWDGDELVKNTNTLSISPAVKAIKIKFSDASLENFAKKIDILNPDSWTKDNVTMYYSRYFELTQKAGRGFGHTRRLIDSIHAYKTNVAGNAGTFYYDIPIEADARALSLKFTYMLTKPNQAAAPAAKYKVSCISGNTEKVWSSKASAWINPDDAGAEYWEELETVINAYLSASLDVEGVPATGNLRITFDISAFSYVSQNNYSEISLSGFDLSFGGEDSETSDDYDYSRTVDVNCVEEIELSLPVASVNRTPNFPYSYALYYIDSEGESITLFHTLGRNDSGTLLDHLVRQMLNFHSRASYIISGDIRSGKHIDMNTVIVDDLYLNKSFYINAQEIDCRGDNFNVEMKELVGDALAQADDGDFHKVTLAGTPDFVCQVEGYLIYTVSGKVYSLSSYSGESIELFTLASGDTIYPCGDVFIVKSSSGYTAYYPNGKQHSSWTGTDYTGLPNAFFPIEGNLLYLTDRMERRGDERVKVGEALMMADPRVDYIDSTIQKTDTLPANSVRYEGGCLILQYSSKSHVFDIRQGLALQEDATWTNVLAMNDMYMVNSNSGLKVYSRQSLALSKITQVASIASADLLALGASEITYSSSGTLHRILLPSGEESSMTIGSAQAVGTLKGLFYIDSVLWVVRSNGAYRLCI